MLPAIGSLELEIREMEVNRVEARREADDI